MSITIQELRNYRAICAEIEQLQTRMEKDKRHVYDAVQTAADFPFWKHTIAIEGDVLPYDSAPIVAKIERLKRKKWKVEKFIGTIHDYKVQRLIILYYVAPGLNAEKMTWEKVADIYGDGMTGPAAKMAVGRYLKNAIKKG